jgi:transaldolase
MVNSRLKGLAAAGVSVWVDQISRPMLESGELSRMVEEDSITGVTSNPTIFAQAIVGTNDYDSQIEEAARERLEPEEAVKRVMTGDIQEACDVLLPVFESTLGGDGHVSVEVSPTLAADTEATLAEAREWVDRIQRPNLLVKVPATKEGIPAIRRLTSEGISVNVTLIFSLDRYAEVMRAYTEGLTDLVARGGDPSAVSSVASFFVSRFDTEVDERLDSIGSEEALSLRGTTAVANARLAYALYLERFESDAFGDLKAAGCRPQRPLWASTSTKNPDYDDLLYVEGLVARGTVNTMPTETIEAYKDHGDPRPRPFAAADIDDATDTVSRLSAVGIDYEDVVATLEEEGVSKFAASWNDLIDGVSEALTAVREPTAT